MPDGHLVVGIEGAQINALVVELVYTLDSKSSGRKAMEVRCLSGAPDKWRRIMRRAIHINGLDVDLELSKVTAVKTSKQMIYLDQLDDGTWRLIYNANLIPDITQVKGFDIIRED